jgi:hypothetical protein
LEIDRPAELFDSEEAAKVWRQLQRGKEWLEDPLPVVALAACSGPVFSGPLLCEWQRAKDIAPAVESGATTDHLVESGVLEFRGQTAWPAFCLAEDWSFELLEEIAWKLNGHCYALRRASSAPQVVFRAVCDFEPALRSAHGRLPTSAIACFFQSWDLHKHITGMCEELKTSTTACSLQASFSDWDDAKWKVRRLVNVCGREVLLTAPRSRTLTQKIAPRTHKTALGRNIDRLRMECGWSLNELTKKTGLEKKQILSHLKHGKGAHPTTMKVYADAFTKALDRHITVNELIKAPPK